MGGLVGSSGQANTSFYRVTTATVHTFRFGNASLDPFTALVIHPVIGCGLAYLTYRWLGYMLSSGYITVSHLPGAIIETLTIVMLGAILGFLLSAWASSLDYTPMAVKH